MAILSPPLSDISLGLLPSYIDPNASVIKCNTYSRYRDDTMILHSANDVRSIVSFIQDISSRVFPPSIPISIEVSIFFTSFLDVCFFPCFAYGPPTTFLRLNLDAPAKVPHFSSNSPTKFLMAPCFSNMVRALRICSEEVLFKIIKELFIYEYVHIGYPEKLVDMLRTKVSILIDKHSSSGIEHVDSVADQYFTPPSSLFCTASNVHTNSMSIWSRCRHLLPWDTRGLPLRLGRNIQSAISCKALYFKKIDEDF